MDTGFGAAARGGSLPFQRPGYIATAAGIGEAVDREAAGTAPVGGVRGLLRHALFRLPPASRSGFRRLADTVLAPVGSIYSAGIQAPLIALTFDDGPDPGVTPDLLDLLRESGCRATFFVLTSRAARHPEIVRRIVAEGHELALHSDRHARLTAVPTRELSVRLATARAELELATGSPVRFFRPPFGAQSLRTYLIARWQGFEVVAWSADAEDFLEGPPRDIAARALAGLDAGDILLMHDGLEVEAGEPPTFDRVEAFRLILDGLRERNWQGVSVGELLAQAGARRRAWFPSDPPSLATRTPGRKAVLVPLDGHPSAITVE